MSGRLSLREAADRALYGAARGAHVAQRELMWRAVDRRYGLPRQAALNVDLSEVDLAAPGRVWYEPSPSFVLPRILRRDEVGPDDVFIDLGCGMGRVVFEAARRYPFRRVLGVEISADFASTARGNLERNLDRLRCRDFEIVTSDILEYELPDDVTIVYMHNPFRGEVFAAALRRILDSADRRPRRLRIVYLNPMEHEQLMATGRIREVRQGRRVLRRWSRTDYLRMYEVAAG